MATLAGLWPHYQQEFIHHLNLSNEIIVTTHTDIALLLINMEGRMNLNLQFNKIKELRA